MEQDERKTTVTVEVDADLKRWLERKSAERLIEGRPYGERSMGAVVRDLIAQAARQEAEVAA